MTLVNSSSLLRKAFHIALFILSFATIFGASVIAQPPADERAPVLLWEQSRERRREYVEYLKERSAADPGNRRLLLDLARGYYSMAMEQDVAAIAEAEKLFNRILADEPQNATALAYRGALLGFRLGFGLTPQDQMYALMRESSANLDRAVALAPDDIEIRGIRGYVSIFTPSFAGRNQFAVEDFAHIIRLLERQPSTERRRAELHLTLGDAYRKAGDNENARRSWLRAIELAPGASAAGAAESRLRVVAEQSAGSDFKEIVAFFGFTIGAAIFAILSFLLLRDLKRARRRRAGIRAALFVSLAAFAWNGLNLLSVIFNALGERALGGLRAWRQSEVALIAMLSPIPFGLIAAYRFYKATFMQTVNDEPGLIATACEMVKEAFAAEAARFIPATDEMARRLAPIFADNNSSVLPPSRINDDKLERELEAQRIELAVAIHSDAELAGLILVGLRAYG